MALDFEAYGEEPIERGGGGGGGGKKKNEHQGKKTAAAQRDFAIEGSKANVEDRLLKHPEVRDNVDTGIDATIKRILTLDEGLDGRPALEAYRRWIYREINSQDEAGIEAECEMEAFKRAKGAGGQKVQKTESAIRIMHKYTGINFEESGDRYQGRNRVVAVERADKLVNEHIEKWVEYVTEFDGSIQELVNKKIQENLDRVAKK